MVLYVFPHLCVLEMINRRAVNYKSGDLIRYFYNGYVPEKYGIIVSKAILEPKGSKPGTETILFTVMTSCGIEKISTDDGWYIDKLN